MNAISKPELSDIDPDDIGHNTTSNPSFEQIVEARLSRRSLFKAGVGTATTAVFGGMALSACGGGGGSEPAPPPAPPAGINLSFNPVAKSLADVVAVPAGYTASVLYRLGDPIAGGVPAYANDGTDAADTYAQRGGDHFDGMHYFGLNATGQYDGNSSTRGLLVMNHEAITPAFLHPTGQTIVGGVRTVADEVLKEFYVHGVSVLEVNRSGAGAWSYNQTSTFNRRIHTLTETELSGPARGAPALVTKFSPNGTRTRGTVNNCAHGYTPWHTYLACEENWAGYFRRVTATDNPNRSAKEIASFTRYGVQGTGRELWATVTPDTADNLYGRWNAERLGTSTDGSDDFRNGPFTYGWCVEIDPLNPTSTPKKRTGMGRKAQEGAWLGPVVAGQPLVWYMGDDSQNEYLYKYVSTANWDPADATRGLAAGDKYLDSGKLFVARFNEDGSGTWLELAFGTNNITAAYAPYAFTNQADVLINARLAADAAGATRMDRPEWAGVNPANGEVYLTLTNNSSRTLDNTNAANPRFYDNTRTNGTVTRGNPNGHIIRLAEGTGGNTATAFRWDVYLFGSRANAPAASNISQLTANNDFSSPDGLWFSNATPGLLWLQTDDGAYTDVTNCMMLAAVPGRVGDGGARTVTNTNTAVTPNTTKTQATFVGAAPTEATLKRFLVGPKECEITGITESPDGTAIFVNIQHPGESTTPNFGTKTYGSYWPYGSDATVSASTDVEANRRRPRSATIVITKNGGGKVAV
ncbi:MAG TPA: PhoX family phosphatase [Burkholderiaceae bacterium]